MRTIAKIVKSDIHAVYRWIKAFAKDNYEKSTPTSNRVVVELDEMWHYINSKNKCWIWKAYCRDTHQFIDRECGGRDNATFSRLYKRLKKWKVKVFFSDNWN